MYKPLYLATLAALVLVSGCGEDATVAIPNATAIPNAETTPTESNPDSPVARPASVGSPLLADASWRSKVFESLRSQVHDDYLQRAACSKWDGPNVGVGLTHQGTVVIDGVEYKLEHGGSLVGIARLGNGNVVVAEDRAGADRLHVLHRNQGYRATPIDLNDEVVNVSSSPYGSQLALLGTLGSGLSQIDTESGELTTFGKPDGVAGGIGMIAASSTTIVTTFDDIPEELSRLGGPWSEEFASQANLYSFDTTAGWTRLTDFRANTPPGSWYLATTPRVANDGAVFFTLLQGDNFGVDEDLQNSLWEIPAGSTEQQSTAIKLEELPHYTTLEGVGHEWFEVAVTVPGGDSRMYQLSPDGVSEESCRVPYNAHIGEDPDLNDEAGA